MRLALVFLLAAAARAGDLPFPPGNSVQELEGSRTALILPDDLATRKERASLVILLHGAGGDGPGLAHALAVWMSWRRPSA